MSVLGITLGLGIGAALGFFGGGGSSLVPALVLLAGLSAVAGRAYRSRGSMRKVP